MRRPILVGYDPRAADAAPVEFGAEIARLTGAPLIIGSVQAGAPVLPMNPGAVQPYAIAQPDSDLLSDCTPALRRVETHLSVPGIEYDCVKLESTSAARALHEEAERDGAAMLVVGSSRRAGSRRVAAGSTAERLLHGAPCPVDVVPRDWTARSTLSTIGVAWTDSEEAREGLRAGWALARRVGAELRAFTVVKETLHMPLETEPRIKEGQLGKDLIDVLGEHKLYAHRQLEQEVEALGGEVPVTTEAFIGDPAEVLVDLSRGVDLLVLGSRGYGPLRSVLLGSVSRRVTARAYCPVSVLPRGVKAPLDALLGETKARARRAAPRPATARG
jgi:nucleotide-binding universal stress UspA family protein